MHEHSPTRTASDRWFETARSIVERDATYLDAGRWDDWVALYATDCEFWVPTQLPSLKCPTFTIRTGMRCSIA